jgi:hypothetical protein
VNDTAQSVVFNADTALPLHGIVSIMGSGYHGCAALDTGEVRCWSLVSDYTGNNAGQLGNGKLSTGTDKFTVLSAALVKVDDSTNLGNVLSVGDDDAVSDAPTTTCAVTKDKFLYCWGSGSAQLIDGVTTPTPFAKRIKSAAAGPDLTGVLQVSVGTTNACVLLDSGKVRCWGQSFGAPFYPATDFTVPGTVTKVLTGYSTSCALNAAGEVYCWGQGGALGIGPSAANSGSPNRVHTSAADPLAGVTDFSIAYGGACALRSDHTVWCWGGTPSGVGMPYATQMQVGGVQPVAGGVYITDAVAITTPFFASAPRYLTSSGVNYWQSKMFAPNCSVLE